MKLEENPVENQRTVTATKVKFSRRNVKSKESPRLKVSKVPFKKKSVKIEILNSFLEANPFKAKKNPLQKSPNDTPELKNDKRKCGRK